MLTRTHPHPPLHRQLWAAAILVFAAPVLLLTLGIGGNTTAPPLLEPAAAIVIIGLVGFAVSESLTSTRLRIAAVLAAVAAVIAVLSASPAFAASDTVSGDTVLTIDTVTLSFLVGSLMPLLTALATKLNASSGLKGIVNMVLSIAGGVLAAFVTADGSLTLYQVSAAAIATYLSAQTVYTGLLRPLGAPQAIQNATPNAGLGSGS